MKDWIIMDESGPVPDRVWEKLMSYHDADTKPFNKLFAEKKLMPEPEPPKEKVNHPPHYHKHDPENGSYEHDEVAENWEMSPRMKDATKYLMRTTKGELLVDTQKCRWYICRMIERPWTALATYDLVTHWPALYPIEAVAHAWFPDHDSHRYKAMIHLGAAVLLSSGLEDIMEHLIAAREHVDQELTILYEK